MLSEEKTIEIVNKYLQRAHEANIRRSFPVVASKIYSDGQLCERIMDYLGDVVFLVVMFFKYKKHNRYADKFEDTYPDAK